MCRGNIPFMTRSARSKGDASSISARFAIINDLSYLGFRLLIQWESRIAFSIPGK
jgi:hypothetical protein